MFKDIKSIERRYQKIKRKYNKVKVEECLDLDRTLLDFMLPRFEVLLTLIENSDTHTHLILPILKLLEIGSILLEDKEIQPGLKLIDSNVQIEDAHLHFKTVEDLNLLDVHDYIEDIAFLRVIFKQVLSDLLFTLTL